MSRRLYDLPPLGPLEAFEASARLLSFTRAADELALTQSAISRQVAQLEDHFGVPLFQRLHRALRLTAQGELLQRSVTEALGGLQRASSQLRGQPRVKAVVVTTTAGFAGLWLIPRLAGFTASRPDVDVRITVSDKLVNLERDAVDVAVRNTANPPATAAAQRLFGGVELPVCSPRLLRDRARPLKRPQDLRHHCLLHIDLGPGSQPLEWDNWLRAHGLEGLKPASVLHFSLYDQMIHAAIDGQGIALGRLPLLQRLLDQRKLVAPFAGSVDSPYAYYVLRSQASLQKPEVDEFLSWLHAEAQGGEGQSVVSAGTPTRAGRATARARD